MKEALVVLHFSLFFFSVMLIYLISTPISLVPLLLAVITYPYALSEYSKSRTTIGIAIIGVTMIGLLSIPMLARGITIVTAKDIAELSAVFMSGIWAVVSMILLIRTYYEHYADDTQRIDIRKMLIVSALACAILTISVTICVLLTFMDYTVSSLYIVILPPAVYTRKILQNMPTNKTRSITTED